MLKVASAQYQIELIKTWEDYVKKIIALIKNAKSQNANLLLLPEYAGIEVAGQQFASDFDCYSAIQEYIPRYIELFTNLAYENQIYIQPGTIIEKISSGNFVNRAYFFSPNHKFGFQNKLQLIEYEKETRILERGNDLKVFATDFGKVGIAICYDCEFPEIVRKLVTAGATLILVPSYTTTTAGFHRVFLSCRARAIENQCFVVVSFAVGSVELSGNAETTTGCAAILSPVDIGFPNDGIISQGKINETELIYGDLSFSRIAAVRTKGQVHNFADLKFCHDLSSEIQKIQL